MVSFEVRFLMQGKEVSLDSVVEAIVRDVRTSVREELNRSLGRQDSQIREAPPAIANEPLRVAVSVREAARLLSLSRRTIENYIASKAIHAVHVGKRVLVPMKSVNAVAARGVPRRSRERQACE